MPQVLLVMRRSGNAKALGEMLARAGYTYRKADDKTELEGLMDPGSRPDAALVDVTDFREEVWEMCVLLQRQGIPFLVVSSTQQRDRSHRGAELGAVSVLTKPLVKSSLLKLLTGLTGVPHPALPDGPV